ncbi:MAG: hypothetical protein ABFS32_09690 [Bacteroidota bacterium]
MKNLKTITRNLLILGLVAFIGCGVFSIHPLYHEEDLIVNLDLVGIWENIDDKDYIRIDTIKDKKYRFMWYEAEDTIYFEAGLVKLDNHYFFDMYPYDDPNTEDSEIGDNFWKNFIPAHSFTKLELKEDTISMAEFDSKRLITLFKENRVRLAHELPDDNYVVITASTNDLQKFVSRYADDTDAFNESDSYRRL